MVLPCWSSTLPAIISKSCSGRRWRDFTYLRRTRPLLAGSLAGGTAKTSCDFLSRAPIFIVLLRTVPAVDFADRGKNSERKSATLPSGSRAAISTVRNFSSG